jgi:predicted DNA-binding WGR domain protein
MHIIRLRDPERRMARYHCLCLQGTLWRQGVAVVHEWGRIGSPGTVRSEDHADEAAARKAVARYLRVKRRKGYGP